MRYSVSLVSIDFGSTALTTFSMQNFSISACSTSGGVLGGDDDVGDARRLAVHVFDGDLRLRVGAQPLAALPALRISRQLRGRGDART